MKSDLSEKDYINKFKKYQKSSDISNTKTKTTINYYTNSISKYSNN
jgi:hypothetical protein